MAKFICEVCGYVHEGSNAPLKCPICQAPNSKFSELDAPKKHKATEFKKINEEDYEIIKVIESNNPQDTREWYMQNYGCDIDEARAAICDIRKKYKVDYGVDKFLPDKDDVFEKLDELREDKTIKESEVYDKLIRWFAQTSGNTREDSYGYLSQIGVEFPASDRMSNGFDRIASGMGCMVNLFILISSVLSLLLIIIM